MEPIKLIELIKLVKLICLVAALSFAALKGEGRYVREDEIFTASFVPVGG